MILSETNNHTDCLSFNLEKVTFYYLFPCVLVLAKIWKMVLALVVWVKINRIEGKVLNLKAHCYSFKLEISEFLGWIIWCLSPFLTWTTQCYSLLQYFMWHFDIGILCNLSLGILGVGVSLVVFQSDLIHSFKLCSGQGQKHQVCKCLKLAVSKVPDNSFCYTHFSTLNQQYMKPSEHRMASLISLQ
jgi:hypothetical protein